MSQYKSQNESEMIVKQLTLRGFDDELRRQLERLAQREGISLNKAVLRLLRKGAGLSEAGGQDDVVGDSLDHLIGTWTDDQEQALLAAIASFDQLDAEMWK